MLDNIVPKDSEVFKNLVNITESIDVDTQSNWITGKAKNMVVRRNANSITVQGSLPKGTKEISVEYTNRKGNLIERMVSVPIGRKKKLSR